MQQKIEKWQRQIDRIRDLVAQMQDYRRWNRVYEEIVAANPQLRPGMPVVDYFRNVYCDYAVMAIRRQARDQKDSISLIGLLRDIADNAAFLTLDWTRDLYEQPHALTGAAYGRGTAHALAEKTFKQFADGSGRQLAVAYVLADIARLEAGTKKVLDHSDRVVAHDDPRGPQQSATFDDLNVAIEAIAEITRRYVLLLTGDNMLTTTPIDTTNALRTFTFPWIDPATGPWPRVDEV